MDNTMLFKLMIYLSLFKRMSLECRFSHFQENDFYDTVWNCSNSGLQELYELPHFPRNSSVALDLSFNKFQTINVSSFIELDEVQNITSLILHHNTIVKIDDGSFAMFFNLKSLDLASCTLTKSTIHKNAFFNLTSLKELRIHDNFFDFLGYPSHQLSQLLMIERLSIDIFEGFTFDHSFNSLIHLRDIFLNPHGIFHLTNMSFHGLYKCPIQYIFFDFAAHVYCNISEDIFCSFPFLKGLKINFGSRCNFSHALRSLKCLQHRTMDYIDVSDIVPVIMAYDPPEFTDLTVKYLKNICVKKLYIRNDCIKYFSFSCSGTNLMQCLEYLDVSQNQGRITIKGFATIFEFPKLKFLNVSRVTICTPNFGVKYHQALGMPSFTFYLPPNFEILDFSFNSFRANPIDRSTSNVTLTGNGLKQLYLANSIEVCQTVTIFDMPSLELLDISGCIFNKIQPFVFQKLVNLKSLHARKSMQNINLSDMTIYLLFASQKSLSFLDLSENYLDDLFLSIFRFQGKSMKTLILDDNMFQTIPNAVGKLRSLSRLSLKGNKIKTISDSDIDSLTKLNNIRIDIGDNLFACSCYAEESLKQIKNIQIFTGLDDLQCLSDEGWRNYEMICISPFWLKFSITTVLILIIIIIILSAIYRNRVIVDYVLLRLRLLMKRQKYDTDEEEFNFDVFILYSGHDHDWVTSTLYNKLVQYGFRVCLHHKDFIPGNCISEEIVKYIDESRKVLFLVTENFLKSSWTSYEVQMAKQHAFRKNRESMIIILMKDNIPISKMPRELRNFWWNIVCAKWPQQECNKEMDIFWKSLKTSIEQ